MESLEMDILPRKPLMALGQDIQYQLGVQGMAALENFGQSITHFAAVKRGIGEAGPALINDDDIAVARERAQISIEGGKQQM